ncbi:MAG: hypothetical protein LBK07_01205 [Tannerella sp.]|jgi:hypothetical protein|nr:hypothetical protein [Tannerella sp.]
MIHVLAGKLAAEEDAAAQKIRELLAKKLKDGKPIELGSSGIVTDQTGKQADLVIQPAKLAAEEDAAAQKIREMLAKKLKDGKPVELDSSGNVTGRTGEQTKLVTQPGKLADYQWYEREPQLFRDEKEGMNRFFPQFKLGKMDDGRYFWHGTLRPGVLPDGWAWEIAAIYNNDHPRPAMGGSVRVVLLKPSIDNVIEALGWRPHHLLYNETDGTYLCTTRADDMSYSTHAVTTAVQTLTWAVKWLTALELVMSGDLSKELFNRPDGI